MKNLKFFLAVICTAYAYTFDCLNYTCNINPVDLGEVCAAQYINKLELNKCKENSVCERIEYDNPSTCVKLEISKGSLLPGERCDANDQCISEDCNKEDSISVCKGKLKGKDCERTNQCDRGLYCKDKKCEETGEGCNDNGEGCSANEICTKKDKKCVKIASKKNNEDSSVPAECQSYYHKDGKCIEGPKLKNLYERECPEDGKCRYLIGGNEINTTCVCVKDNIKKKRCAPGRGDIDTNAVILVLTH